MKYLGNYAEDYSDLNFKFSTHKADGTPYSLAGGVISVYKSNSTTESAAGVTLTADFDGRTGLNNVKIDLSADALYAAGYDYAAVITAGTVNAVSVVGTVVALFSIDNRYMRGTDGAATSTQAVDIQSRLPAALIGGQMDSVATVDAEAIAAAIAATGELATPQDVTDAIDAANLASSGTGEVEFVHTVTISGTPMANHWVGFYTEPDCLGEPAAEGRTNTFGQVTLHLTAGFYYVKVLATGMPVTYDTATVVAP